MKTQAPTFRGTIKKKITRTALDQGKVFIHTSQRDNRLPVPLRSTSKKKKKNSGTPNNTSRAKEYLSGLKN